MFFLNFVLVAAATAFLAVLLNPFIELWVGPRYVLAWPVTALIVVNFFLYGIRQTAVTFINACGLFWPVRYKSLVEAALSVLLSLLFLVGFHLGIAGALLSVTISTIATNIWWEPFVVMRTVLGAGAWGVICAPLSATRPITSVVTVLGGGAATPGSGAGASRDCSSGSCRPP